MSTIHNTGPDVGHRWTKAILKHWQLGARKHVASYNSKFLLHLVTRCRNVGNCSICGVAGSCLVYDDGQM